MSFFKKHIVAAGLILLIGPAHAKDQASAPDASHTNYVRTIEDKATFDTILAQSNKLVIIDISADWCNPCKQLNPVFHKLAKEQQHLYTFCEINASKIDNALLEYLQQLGIQMFPTIALFKQKNFVNKFAGFSGEAKLKEDLQMLIDSVDKSLDQFTKEQRHQMLIKSIQMFDVDEVRKILKAGVDVNAPDEHGLLPIMWAMISAARVGEKGIQIVHLVVDAGAALGDVQIKDEKINVETSIKQMLAQAQQSVKTYKEILDYIETKKKSA